MQSICVSCVAVFGWQAPSPPAAWSSAILSHTEELLEGMEPKHISLLLLGLGGLKVGCDTVAQARVT